MIPRSPLKRSGTPRKKRRGKARRGRLRDAKYLAFVHQLPCTVCLGNERSVWWPICATRPGICCGFYGHSIKQDSRTESAHIGARGLGQKCSDRETIPLCAAHHRTGKDSHHVLGKRFFEHHGLNRDEIVTELQRLYLE